MYFKVFIPISIILQSAQVKLVSEAPACEVGRLARAVEATEGGLTSRSLHAATKVGESHGERDAQRVFNKFGLSLNVPISSLEVGATTESGPVSIPYLKVIRTTLAFFYAVTQNFCLGVMTRVTEFVGNSGQVFASFSRSTSCSKPSKMHRIGGVCFPYASMVIKEGRTSNSQSYASPLRAFLVCLPPCGCRAPKRTEPGNRHT